MSKDNVINPEEVIKIINELIEKLNDETSEWYKGEASGLRVAKTVILNEIIKKNNNKSVVNDRGEVISYE